MSPILTLDLGVIEATGSGKTEISGVNFLIVLHSNYTHTHTHTLLNSRNKRA